MNSVEKVKALYNLVELINFYYEGRDLPSNINYFEEVEQLCESLDVDFNELKLQFGLKQWDEF